MPSSPPDPTPHTTQLRAWVHRIQAGDRAARDELLRSVGARLERLARQMLRRFPNVARWAETGDVLQGALIRLLHALEKIEPESTRRFYGLAAEQMRRELLDLARRYRGPRAAAVPLGGADSQAAAPEPAARDDGPAELDRWAAFHEEVSRLPPEEREVVSLVFYHGWGQAEVAELFGVDVRTVRRRWHAALLKLRELLGEPPGLA